MCQRGSYPFLIITDNIKWVTTSWTHSTVIGWVNNMYLAVHFDRGIYCTSWLPPTYLRSICSSLNIDATGRANIYSFCWNHLPYPSPSSQTPYFASYIPLLFVEILSHTLPPAVRLLILYHIYPCFLFHVLLFSWTAFWAWALSSKRRVFSSVMNSATGNYIGWKPYIAHNIRIGQLQNS